MVPNFAGSRCFPLLKSFPLLAKVERPRKTLHTGYLFCRWYETLQTILDIIDETFKSPHPHPPPQKKEHRGRKEVARLARRRVLIHYFTSEKGGLLFIADSPRTCKAHKFD